jgi:hypothetical protein
VGFESEGMINDERLTDRLIDSKTYAPEQILLGEEEVPSKYKDDEDDTLYDNWYRNLPPQLSLPDSDLLHAIHAYVSDFYSIVSNNQNGFQSMDGTALLAMGILLDEMVTEMIGETGQLAFLESERMYRGGVRTFWNGIREVPFYYKGNQQMERTTNSTTSGGLSSEQQTISASNSITRSEFEDSDEEREANVESNQNVQRTSQA